MGIHDRDYYRPQQNPSMPSIGMPRTIIGIIILINVVVFLVDAFTPDVVYRSPLTGRLVITGHWLSDQLAVHVYTLTRPWLWWQMLTYGFSHSPFGFGHIFANMLTLFFLGRDIEYTYGRKEFLRLYLVMIVFAALVWMIAGNIAGQRGDLGAIGASGAIAGVVVLYALNFPHRTLLLFFVIPVPAWLLGMGVVLFDVYGALNREGSNVAYTMHLAGAGFAFVYYQQRWRLSNFSLPKLKPRTKLKVHDPEAADKTLSEEVDRILEKIHSQGEGSLTRKEKKTLESASREFQKRRK